MKILAIETSCDDTCVAVLEIKNWKLEILSNIVSSQVKLHAKYGGIYPTLAKREHQRNLLPVLVQALKQSKLLKISNFKFLISKQILNSNFQIPKPNIDLIAVTNGPGLEPCLWTGINFAKEISKNWGLPIIPVNHIEGHIFANWLTPISESTKLQVPNHKQIQMTKIQNSKQLEFPAICLIVSGGHTQLILMEDIGSYKILGETRDDAAGECFDKTARILGLGYPGGPAIAEQAQQRKFQITNTKLQTNTKYEIRNTKYEIRNTGYKIQLPRPMIYQKNYDFSFSGLKTAVLTEVKKKKRKGKKFIQTIADEIQQAIIDVLIRKTLKAAKDYQVETIILGGGVIANTELRKQLGEKIKKSLPNTKYIIPNTKYCTDNAAMIGITAFFNLQKKTKSSMNASHSSATLRSLHSLAYLENIKADANLRINAKCKAF